MSSPTLLIYAQRFSRKEKRFSNLIFPSRNAIIGVLNPPCFIRRIPDMVVPPNHSFVWWDCPFSTSCWGSSIYAKLVIPITTLFLAIINPYQPNMISPIPGVSPSLPALAAHAQRRKPQDAALAAAGGGAEGAATFMASSPV